MKPMSTASLIALSMSACALASGAEAHAHLTGATPANNGVVRSSPASIRASFSEALVPAFSSLKLVTSRGAALRLGKTTVDPRDHKTLVAPISRPLAPGDYVVEWKAVSADTHRMSGRFSFHLRP